MLNTTGQETGLHTGAKPGLFYGYIVVIAALVIMVLAWGTFFSYGIFFTPLVAEFGWTRAITSGAFTLASLIRGFLGITTGKLSDKFGLRIVVSVCVLLMGSGYLLLSQTTSVWQLYLFFGVIIAIGISGCWTPLLAMVARWFVKRRGMMTGLVTSGVSIGTIIIPPVSTRLVSGYGWRNSYIIIGIATLVLILLSAQFLRSDPRQSGHSPYGENEKKQALPATSVEGLSIQEAIHTTQFWMICITYFSYGFLAHTIMIHIAPHATDLGISLVNAANVLAIIGVTGIAGRLFMGSASDKIDIKSSIIFVFIVASIILLWLQLAQELWMFYLFAIIFGFAYGGLSALQPLLIARYFGLSSLGIILGTLSFSFTTGGAAGVFLAGYMFDITGNYQLAFLVCASLGFVGLILTAFLKPIKDTQI